MITDRVYNLRPGMWFKWNNQEWLVIRLTDERIYFCMTRNGGYGNGNRNNYSSLGRNSRMIVEVIGVHKPGDATKIFVHKSAAIYSKVYRVPGKIIKTIDRGEGSH